MFLYYHVISYYIIYNVLIILFMYPFSVLTVDRMATCLRVLGTARGNEAAIQRIWLELCRESFSAMVKDKLHREAAEAKKEVSPLIRKNR